MNISYLAMSDIPSKNANSLQIVQMCNAFIENGNKVKLVAPCFDHTENISVKNYYGIKNKIQIIRIGKKRKDLSKLDNKVENEFLASQLAMDIGRKDYAMRIAKKASYHKRYYNNLN